MKKNIIIGILLTASLSVAADKMVIHQNDGSSQEVVLTETTVLKIAQKDGEKVLSVQDNGKQSDVAISVIKNLTFEEDASSLTDIQGAQLTMTADNGFIVIESTEDMQEVRVWNVQGAQVFAASASGKNIRIATDNLTQGVYIVNVQTQAGKANGKVLLQ